MVINTWVAALILVNWTLISGWLYYKNIRKKRKLLYSDVLALMTDAKFQSTNTPYQKLVGWFKGHQMAFVPMIDTLSFRTLPQLYIRIYIFVSGEFKGRFIKKENSYNLCFHNCSKLAVEILVKDEEFPSLSLLENCHEILIKENFVRVTLPATRAKKAYYLVTRAAVFPPIILKTSAVSRTLAGVLALREELISYGKVNHNRKDTCLGDSDTVNACASCRACPVG